MTGAATRDRAQPTIAIIGAGFSGLCAAIRLKQAGFEHFTVYEQGSDVGGVWRENTYPGAACDVPWHLYSFSFERNAGFSCVYPEQPEILAYQRDCARRHGIYSHVVFDTTVTAAHYHDDSGGWRIVTADGRAFAADIVIFGVGQLDRPAYPDIAGRDDFAGHSFHCAAWDHGHDLSGRRVAVIGTGASAIQFVPKIAPEVAELRVFQRSAPWLLPRFQRSYGRFSRWLFRTFGWYSRIFRLGLFGLGEASVPAFNRQSRLARVLKWIAARHRRRQIDDPALRAALTPDYPIGCKRVLFSSDYYPAMARDNVSLVSSPIARIVPDGIVTRDGTTHAVDTIIYGTGFKATEFLAPVEVTGRGGRSLAERWSAGAEAYLGITVDGFPNLFMCYGPNTNLGGNSIIYMIECQVDYILDCVQRLADTGAQSMEVRGHVIAAHNRRLQAELADTVWSAGCHNWYRNADGRITNNWSGTNSRYRRWTRAVRIDDFIWRDREGGQRERVV